MRRIGQGPRRRRRLCRRTRSRGAQRHQPHAPFRLPERRRLASPPGGPARQPRQGRVGRGRAEPQPDARLGGGRGTVILRRAMAADALAIAFVHRTAMRVSLNFLPELHTAEQDLAYFACRFLPSNEVWVAEAEGQVVGYVGFDADWINHLYILPDFQGRRIGRKLLARPMAHGAPKRLWTFQPNARARKFYEDRGFVAVQFTDGEGNEEKTPDVCYEWRPDRICPGL